MKKSINFTHSIKFYSVTAEINKEKTPMNNLRQSLLRNINENLLFPFTQRTNGSKMSINAESSRNK